MKLPLTFYSNLDKESRSSAVIKLFAAIKSLDDQTVQSMIKDDGLFLENQKYDFLNLVLSVFKACRTEGHNELFQVHSVCRLCFSGDRVVGFKDSNRNYRLGLVFRPLISDAREITVCKRFTDPEHIYGKDVYFAPRNLSGNEIKGIGELMDRVKVPNAQSDVYKEMEKLIAASENLKHLLEDK